MEQVRRGYVPEDEAFFYREESLGKLCQAQKDLLYLIERGYPMKNASVFTGNHYLLSERQRLALVRATSSRQAAALRGNREVIGPVPGKEVHIDGFNIIITLEIALSGSTLLKCMDGTIRDLAGLRGTYRIIGKTHEAIRLLLCRLKELETERAVFYLDSPVSNSGKLRALILDTAREEAIDCQVHLVPNADAVLKETEHVITSDAIILDHCKSWLNPLPGLLSSSLPGLRFVDLTMQGPETGPKTS
ncbi:MAG: DUF434 domain-containing protein [Enterocloster clostridioformis]|nr:DUF434 domain-containing protein [Enterocloster clostridioformis]